MFRFAFAWAGSFEAFLVCSVRLARALACIRTDCIHSLTHLPAR